MQLEVKNSICQCPQHTPKQEVTPVPHTAPLQNPPKKKRGFLFFWVPNLGFGSSPSIPNKNHPRPSTCSLGLLCGALAYSARRRCGGRIVVLSCCREVAKSSASQKGRPEKESFGRGREPGGPFVFSKIARACRAGISQTHFGRQEELCHMHGTS